jgi:hypothetical protein
MNSIPQMPADVSMIEDRFASLKEGDFPTRAVWQTSGTGPVSVPESSTDPELQSSRYYNLK